MGQITLNLGLDIVDSIGRFDLESDGLARKGLDEDLHDGLGMLVSSIQKKMSGTRPRFTHLCNVYCSPQLSAEMRGNQSTTVTSKGP